MKNYTSENIRNICLMSHGSAGKTTLAEAMLFNAKATDRLGSVNDGTTVCDFDPEETKRHITINTSVAPFEWKNTKINIIDTPGYFDFAGEVVGAARAVETAVIVVPAKNGVEVGTEKSWEYAVEANLRKLFFISKMDEENADYFKSYNQLVEKFGKKVIAFEFPIIENEKFVGIVDVIHQKAKHFEGDKFVEAPIPEDLIDKVAELREPLMEAVAETSEELMEKYFEAEGFTDEEIHIGLLQGIEDDEIIPVICGSAAENAGIQFLMDAIVEYVPAPSENKTITVTDMNSEETIELKTEPGETLSALVFKTIADPFVGKISIFKVFSGEIKSDMHVYNSRTGKNEKMSNLFTVRGKKQENASVITAGDIGAVAKINDTKTNDTFSDPAKPVVIDPIDFPKPSISLAVEPATKGDEEKIGSGLHKLRDEDPTFSVTVNSETHQTLVSGLGEQHLDIIMSKLKSKYGVSVILKDPIVPYRETIKKKIRVEGKYKKQSGGHGQYGHVHIEFEPGEEEALDFQEKIFGGSVPKQYIPAVEKGLKDCIHKGVLAGYPVVKLRATLVDGSYHAVDSSEMAFKMAANVAYKKLVDAQPCLLEPIAKCEIIIPDDYMGDIIGDMNKRRGRIMGMVPMAGGKQTIEAEVPMAEMFKYATDLRSMTQGRGQFSMEMVRYDEVPASQAPKIVDEAKRKKEEK
ncbi:MAG: elongation factor G [Clostridiales bacterium]|nr:elongation factor G [Clostridiales bacterium]